MAQGNSRAIQEIKARLSLVDIARRYVELRRNGPRWVAPCPFHQETKPSFSINEEEGFFYCFGCQASGDLFDFYGQINGPKRPGFRWSAGRRAVTADGRSQGRACPGVDSC